MLWQRSTGFYREEQDLGALIKRVAEGDARAFAIFYDATSTLIYGLALRMLGSARAAEDVVCEAYSQVWEGASRYSHEGCAPLTWLVMITRGFALHRLRSGRLNKRDDESSEDNDGRGTVTTAYREHSHEISTQGEDVLSIPAALSPDEHQALELSFFSGLTTDEIAKHLNQPGSEIRKHLRQGLMKMRETSTEPRKRVARGARSRKIFPRRINV